MVPGHEIVGKVAEVGRPRSRSGAPAISSASAASSIPAASARPAEAGEEQYCEVTFDLQRNRARREDPTYGGYSHADHRQRGLRPPHPEGFPLDAAAPLLCAGITTYSPLRHLGVRSGHRSRSSGSAVSATWA